MKVAYRKEVACLVFSPMQGHVPAAFPFVRHALMAMIQVTMKRAMFIAKGSLFLGRMLQLSDGMPFILEANPGTISR